MIEGIPCAVSSEREQLASCRNQRASGDRGVSVLAAKPCIILAVRVMSMGCSRASPGHFGR